MEIEARGIGHRYGELAVLDGLSFTVVEGRVLAVIGPSGCGKSTLLRILGGLIAPTSGQVLARGEAPPDCLNPITYVFQDFALVNGNWRVKGELVRPQDITTSALLTIEGELDDISGAGQTRAAHDLCTGIPKNRQFHYDAIGAGHYGIFSGRRWREKIYPRVREFIASHQPAPAAARTLAAVTPAARAKPAAKKAIRKAR